MPSGIKRRRVKLTLKRVNALLSYDRKTGIFTSKVQRGKLRPGSVVGSPTNGYLDISIDWVKYKAHDLAWFISRKKWPAFELDHKDRNRSNNRLSNLRKSNHSLNAVNTKDRPSASGHRGVDKIGKRWRAYISVNSKFKHLGMFDTLEDAARCRTKTASNLYGEFST